MNRLVVLKLDGDLQTEGFRVSLEIGLEGYYPQIEINGFLPPFPELANRYYDWQEKYKSIESMTRLKPRQVIYSGSIDEQIRQTFNAGGIFGDRFNKWLDSEGFCKINHRLREEFCRQDFIRVLIQTDNQELWKFPWHLWNFFNLYPNAEVALSSVNYEKPKTSFTNAEKSKLRILAILGYSRGIDIETDRNLISNITNAETVFLVEPRRCDINDQLWEQSWDIIFFAGHSETKGKTGRIYINPTESLTVAELCFALGRAVESGLKLAIFNSCDGLRLAQELNNLQIPQIIVMREFLSDVVAHEFLKYFLVAFTAGNPIYLAVREARERLQILEAEHPCASWLPVIFQNPSKEPLTWINPSSTNKEKLKFKSIKNKVVTAAILLSFGLGLWQLAAPKITILINNWRTFQTALKLDPNNPAIIYNEAYQCEDIKDFECAKTKYMQAAKMGFAPANSNLARLYIKQYKDYDNAVNWVQKGLEDADDDPKEVKYALIKNLGWARLGKGRYKEAKDELQKAIEIESDRAPAYCLLAETIETQAKALNLQKYPQSAIENWKKCLAYASNEERDENDWIDIARQRLVATAQQSVTR
jgi:Tfp pilus assembly protein PilF